MSEKATPWVNVASARRSIAALQVAVAISAITTVVSVAICYKVATQPPRLVVNNLGEFMQAELEPVRISRDDVEQFVQYIIPRLKAPQFSEDANGLEQLRKLVAPNILTSELQAAQALTSQQNYLQFAVVTSIEPTTMSIQRDKKRVYVEAYGYIGLTDKSGRSQIQPVRWKMELLLLDILTAKKQPTISETAKKSGEPPLPVEQISYGNARGLYLRAIVEADLSDTSVPKGFEAGEEDRKEWQEQQERAKNIANLAQLLRNGQNMKEQAEKQQLPNAQGKETPALEKEENNPPSKPKMEKPVPKEELPKIESAPTLEN